MVDSDPDAGQTSSRRTQEQLVQQAVGSTRDFVTITDTGKILYVNQASLARHGYREQELIGRHISVLQSSNNPSDYCRTAHEATLRDNWSGELLDISKDGVEFPIFLTSTVIRDERGNPVAAVGIGREITETKKAENALRSTQEFLVSLLEHTPASIYVQSADERYLLVNSTWERITGKRREDVLGCRVKEVFPDEAARQFRDSDLVVINTRGPVTFEHLVNLADGPHAFLTVKFPLRDATGAIHAVAGVSIDITEQRRAEVALRQRERELRTLTEHLPDVVARFDRDLRHVYVNRQVETKTGLPASSFLGKTNRELGMPPRYVAQWETALRETFGIGCARTIEFTYPTPGGMAHFESRLVPEFAPTGVVETVLCINRDVTSSKRLEQQQNAVAVSDLPAGVITEFANLMTNVLAYAELLISRLPIDDRNHAFAERIQQSANRAQEIVSQLAISDEKRTPPATGNGPAPVRSPATVLVVEDDEIGRSFLQQALEAGGYRVLTGRDGQEGLEVFRANADSISLVVTDIVMPQMAGDLMVAGIRKLSASTPILVVTGYERGETAERLRALNITGFVAKPFTAAVLLEQVRQTLAQHAPS